MDDGWRIERQEHPPLFTDGHNGGPVWLNRRDFRTRYAMMLTQITTRDLLDNVIYEYDFVLLDVRTGRVILRNSSSPYSYLPDVAVGEIMAALR